MSGVRISEQGFEPATPQVEEGARLLLEEIEYKFSIFPVDDAALREMIDRCQSLGHSLYTVAGESGRIIAAAEVDQPEGQDTMVHNIAVEEAQRGHGIGRMLMRHIAGRAAEEGAGIIHVFPVDGGFFKRLGFVTDPDDEAMMLATPEDILRS